MMSLIRPAALLASVAALMFVSTSMATDAMQPRTDKKEAKATAEIGKPAPDFTLKDLKGETFKLSDHKGKIVVLEWFNPDCPFVVKHHEVHKTMEETYKRHKDKGVVWVAINSAAPGLQGAGQERNDRAYREFEMVYPLLIDEPGTVGRAYGARVSPQMYIINREGILVYNGAIDNDRHRTRLGEINYVDQALGQVIRGETVSPSETRAYGCTVKYKD